MWDLWILVLLCTPTAVCPEDSEEPEEPIVQTNYGPVRGFVAKATDGKKANVFLGIPFAKPPVQELRFEKPQKPDNWTEPLAVKAFRPGCFPHHRSGVYDTKSCSEDCLYLNIVAPPIQENHYYPVIFWIHGGSYNMGGAELHSYENITNNYAIRNIVFVTPQYRLGPFGFMSTGDNTMPGNYGLWDQVAALEFVRENIEYFGGDPMRITVQGLDAGGSSASCLTLSPHSQGMISRSIQMSGSAFSEWSSSQSVHSASYELALQLGCDLNSLQTVKKCLQQKTPEQFLDAVDKVGKVRDNIRMLKFCPRIDGDFFPSSFDELIKNGPKIPSIIGVSEKEGIMFALLPYVEPVSNLQIQPKQFKYFDRNKLIEIIKKKFATVEDFGEQAEKAQQKLIHYYANPEGVQDSDYKHWLQQYNKLITDVLFAVAARREAELKVRNGWPVWLYITDYYNAKYLPKDFPDLGATHGTENTFLFAPFTTKTKVFDEEDLKLQKLFLNSFTNFAVYGNPSTEAFQWHPVAAGKPLTNLRFRPQPVTSDDFFDNAYNFWTTMDELNYDIITGRTQTRGSIKTEL